MIKIRSAVKQDAVAILNVHRDAVLAKAAGYYPETTLNDWSPGATPERIARMENEIEDIELILLVAEASGEIIGFARATPLKNEVTGMYVKPNLIGKVGHQLLKELEKRAFKVCDYLTCDSSLNAERFYKENGFIEVRRADHILRSGKKMASVQMKKRRPPI